MINDKGTFSGYVQNRMGVGLYFIFVACAGISIIVWVFNWICWLNQCCCCDFLHNPVNKRIAWWMSFIFLLGILACCIAGCVTVNRFGFALEGARCALDRIYYDSIDGQIKVDEPKWKGFVKLSKMLSGLKIGGDQLFDKDQIDCTYCEFNTEIEPLTEKYNNILTEVLKSPNVEEVFDSLIKLFNEEIDKFKTLKNEGNFLDGCYYYERILKGCMKILAMIYFCLLLITVTLAGVSLMFYACLKRQGYLITLMHVLWNIIRFFMVSFFIFGTAYGIIDLALTDSIAVIQYLFSEEYRQETLEKKIVPNSDLLANCLTNPDYNYLVDYKNAETIITEALRKDINNFFKAYRELVKTINKDTKASPKTKNYIMCNGKDNPTVCDTSLWIDRGIILNEKGNFFESFNCGFLKNDFNILYKALYDASKESEYLAAISLCASFFGAVAVYFYLLVLHHYNNEMFYDSGKSIFKGFDGYGGGFKKKNIQKDPAYKKRKLRAEIELTSKNDEASGYNKDINKNEDEEE